MYYSIVVCSQHIQSYVAFLKMNYQNVYKQKRTPETLKAVVCIFVITITKAGALQFAQKGTADWLHFAVFRATPTDTK
jgi:hypothetical protein